MALFWNVPELYLSTLAYQPVYFGCFQTFEDMQEVNQIVHYQRQV
jgi:hypothetical protein